MTNAAMSLLDQEPDLDVAYLELFWSVFSRMRNEYGDLQRESPFSVQMLENTDQQTPNTDTFQALCSGKSISEHFRIFSKRD